MRVETINGRHLLCGHFLSVSQIQAGQEWASADGSNRVVKVRSVRNDWVVYSWPEYGRDYTHEKEAFSFQCRYCLVLPTNEILEELL